MFINKKLPFILSSITILGFIIFFFRMYRKEGISVRKSLKLAWSAAMLFFAVLFGPMNEATAKGADGWSNPAPIHRSSPRNGLFGSNSRSSNSQSSGSSRQQPARYLPRYRHKPVENRSPSNPLSGLFGSNSNDNGAGGGKKPQKSIVEYDYNLPKKAKKSMSNSNSDHSSVVYDKNSHLDRKVKLNGRVFNLKRSKIEKKTPKHGIDLGLQPEIGSDGKPIIDKKTNKPRVKNNKKNFELFADNLEALMRKSEMREGFFRKGRNNEQQAINFYDAETNVVASFNKDTGDFISLWKMDKAGQIDEFLNNNNVI